MSDEQKIAEAERLLTALGWTKHKNGYWSNLTGGLVWVTTNSVDRLLPDLREAVLHNAAPDLLAALKDLVKANEDWHAAVQKVVVTPPGWTDGYLDRARAAIAKAEGHAS